VPCTYRSQNLWRDLRCADSLRLMDGAADNREKLKDSICFFDSELTSNVLLSKDGKTLMMLHEAGLQYLYGGARANTGIARGRYMVEVRAVEQLAINEAHATRSVWVGPHMLRLGLSVAGTSLLMGDTEDSVCFDTDGTLMHNRASAWVTPRQPVMGTFALVFDADNHKVSFFRDGAPVGPQQELPEALKGKTLFPTVTFKNLKVQVNFGPSPLRALASKCRMLQDAAADDVAVASEESLQKSGKWEVLFPVFLPDEGGFDWSDWFLETNPSFVELSDRKLLDWITRSGLRRTSQTKSVDKPDFGFGVPSFDNGTVKQLLAGGVSEQKRNVLMMEVRGNLVKEDRKSMLNKFRQSHHRKIAEVMIGNPDDAFRERTQSRLLTEKQAEAQKKRKLDQVDDGPPVTLTDEERQVKFRKLPVPDLTTGQLNACFTKFCLPSEEEGFDEIRYSWLPKSDSGRYVEDWVRSRKLTTRIEDLQPSDWFRERWQEWQKHIQAWHNKHMEFKSDDKRATVAMRAAAAKAKKVPNGGVEPADKDPMVLLEEEIEAEEMDIFGVENVEDMGNGEPLYMNFTHEEWALLCLRFELHLLVHSFLIDSSDPDRSGIPVDHLNFYYHKYYKKSLLPKSFGVETLDDMLMLVRDTVIVSPKTKVLESQLSSDQDLNELFLKLTEEDRRDRQLRLENGDRTAELKIPRPAPGMTTFGAVPAQPAATGAVPGGSLQQDGARMWHLQAKAPPPTTKSGMPVMGKGWVSPMTAGPGQQQLATPGLSPGPVGQMCAGVMGGSMGGPMVSPMGAGMAAGGAMGSSGAPPASMPAGPGGAGSPCPIRASQMGMAGGMGGPSPQPGGMVGTGGMPNLSPMPTPMGSGPLGAMNHSGNMPSQVPSSLGAGPLMGPGKGGMCGGKGFGGPPQAFGSGMKGQQWRSWSMGSDSWSGGGESWKG